VPECGRLAIKIMGTKKGSASVWLLALVFGAMCATSGCVVSDNPYSALPPGKWRGVLYIEYRPVSGNPRGEPLPEKLNLQFEEVAGGELPFNFEVKYPHPDSFYLEIQNDGIPIVLNHIVLGRDNRTAKDTFQIFFPDGQSFLRGTFSENVLEGEWVDLRRENYSIRFLARHGRDYRFTTMRKAPVTDLSGTWDLRFEPEEGEGFNATGEFRQNGNTLRGDFKTPAGGFRHLEGTIQGNKLYLSAFDGRDALLVEGKILPDSTITGALRNGKDFRCIWEARRSLEKNPPNEGKN
jgi:hypothetical protein